MNQMGSFHVVGIDGGGSGCRVAIAGADGALRATAAGGAANYFTEPEGTVRNLRQAIARAAGAAGLDQAALRHCVAHLGLAGILREADGRAVAAALPFLRCRVSDDRLTSMAGALGDSDGALAAIGTGSTVAARHGGSVRLLGGWGLQLGDQAAGAWLGRGALGRCLLVHDGLADPSALTCSLMARFGGDPVELVEFARRARPEDHAALAPEIVGAARKGDIHGVALMREGAAYLETCFAAVGISGADIICLTGGLGPHYAPWLASATQARIAPPRGTALDGALALARRAATGLDLSA